MDRALPWRANCRGICAIEWGGCVGADPLGTLLRDLAGDLPDICEGARGEGLLWGLVLRPGLVAREVLPRVQEAGVLLTAAGERVLRFSPPLVVSTAELEEGVRAVRAVLSDLGASTIPVKRVREGV